MDGALTDITLFFDEDLNWYILDGDRLRIYGTVSDLQTPMAARLIGRVTGLPYDEVRHSIRELTGDRAKFQRQVTNILNHDDPRIMEIVNQLTDERSFHSIYRQDLELLAAQEREMDKERATVAEQILQVKKSRFLVITLRQGGGSDGERKDGI